MDSSKKHHNLKGLYLVLDPSLEINQLIQKLESALAGGVNIVQIWNNWPSSSSIDDKIEIINQIVKTANVYQLPVLINEEYTLLSKTDLAGVHFDQIPDDFERLTSSILENKIIGITCGNDIERIHWANDNKIDYISFCSIFPSKSAGECEIVSRETLALAKTIAQIPFFVSGGVTTENLKDLSKYGMAGAAVISGVLNAESPKQKSQEYNQALNKIIK
ncbi:thiamine phosphate synthase [Brumimicrobium mesophilum]|uniref:thiamine phosphate synthase n=1 Tax=Brumimicrobium mesophilum TaxID=392717 RepID=UPI000D14017A|nr:thiamine phosphate synthase [Brumimicrobium mesophilum]